MKNAAYNSVSISHKIPIDRLLMLTADRLAELVDHRAPVREVAGSNPGRTNTQGL